MAVLTFSIESLKLFHSTHHNRVLLIATDHRKSITTFQHLYTTCDYHEDTQQLAHKPFTSHTWWSAQERRLIVACNCKCTKRKSQPVSDVVDKHLLCHADRVDLDSIQFEVQAVHISHLWSKSNTFMFSDLCFPPPPPDSSLCCYNTTLLL